MARATFIALDRPSKGVSADLGRLDVGAETTVPTPVWVAAHAFRQIVALRGFLVTGVGRRVGARDTPVGHVLRPCRARPVTVFVST
jgi:hypothetical protein